MMAPGPRSSQDQRGTRRPSGKMQKKRRIAGYWMSAPRPATCATITLGYSAASEAASCLVVPKHPKVMSKREEKSPITSRDLRQKMMLPTVRKTREEAAVMIVLSDQTVVLSLSFPYITTATSFLRYGKRYERLSFSIDSAYLCFRRSTRTGDAQTVMILKPFSVVFVPLFLRCPRTQKIPLNQHEKLVVWFSTFLPQPLRDGNSGQMDILHGGPNNRKATGLRGKSINLIGPLPNIAEKAFNRIGTANVTMHHRRESIKREEMLLIFAQAADGFGIAFLVFGFKGR